MREVFKLLIDSINEGQQVVLISRYTASVVERSAAIVTVVSTEGSTPRGTGAKMIVLLHGQTFGSIGGGCTEAEVTIKARDIIRDGGYCLLDLDLTDSAEQDDMVCGGHMKVLIEAVD